LNQYNLHKETCQDLGIPQATLKHRGLLGTLGTASSTGVKQYTGPDPRTTPPTTTDTLVWATWQPLFLRSTNEPQTGRQGAPRLIGQMPTIDDNQNPIVCNHDDELLLSNGQRMKIINPSLQPDGGFFTFQLLQRR
jgi:hypothetical protein